MCIRDSGVTEHSIVGGERLWYWYDDDKQALEGEADQRSQDLLQYIPTYEDVLALDPGQITGTGYEEKDGARCIYVEVYREELGYLERYWISVSSGCLLYTSIPSTKHPCYGPRRSCGCWWGRICS